MHRSALILVVTLMIVPAVQADLRTKMSEAEFEAAGLRKLNAGELDALSAWIERQSQPTPPATPDVPVVATHGARPSTSPPPVAPADAATETTAEARFGQEQLTKPREADVPEQITTKINGEFRGWDGKTIFRLNNGQIWQQRVGGKYRGPKRTDPQVLIEKGRFGYYLRLLESGRSVGVKRLR